MGTDEKGNLPATTIAYLHFREPLQTYHFFSVQRLRVLQVVSQVGKLMQIGKFSELMQWQYSYIEVAHRTGLAKRVEPKPKGRIYQPQPLLTFIIGKHNHYSTSRDSPTHFNREGWRGLGMKRVGPTSHNRCLHS